jgi:hypothetical protein
MSGRVQLWRLLGHGLRRHAAAMFVVTEAEAAAIRAVFEQQGELSAAIELRRLFPGVVAISPKSSQRSGGQGASGTGRGHSGGSRRATSAGSPTSCGACRSRCSSRQRLHDHPHGKQTGYRRHGEIGTHARPLTHFSATARPAGGGSPGPSCGVKRFRSAGASEVHPSLRHRR